MFSTWGHCLAFRCAFYLYVFIILYEIAQNLTGNPGPVSENYIYYITTNNPISLAGSQSLFVPSSSRTHFWGFRACPLYCLGTWGTSFFFFSWTRSVTKKLNTYTHMPPLRLGALLAIRRSGILLTFVRDVTPFATYWL